MSVRINLDIGHEAAIRSKLTIEGFTHDWHVFVTGIDNADIQQYIEKVVFHLHETFQNPKRVIKEPPYSVRESGYAGFNLPIDIYLRNNDEPKKIRFNYDLNLQPNGPAIARKQREKYVFNNPSEEFKHKLLKGGGLLHSSSDTSKEHSSTGDKMQLNKPKLSSTSDIARKHKVKEHRAEDSFTDLFGTPITKTSKISPDPIIAAKSSPSTNSLKSEKNSNTKKSKSKHSPKEKDKDRDKEKKEKNPEKKHKEEKKSKDRNKEKDRKEKSSKRERSPKQTIPSPRRSPKRSSSPPKKPPSPKRPPSPPPKIKTDDKKIEDQPKEKIKSESSKIKREQKEKDKEQKEKHKSHKDKDNVNRSSEQKEHRSSSKESKPSKEPVPVKQKEKSREENPIVKEPEKVEKIKTDKSENVEKVEKVEKSEKSKHKHKKKSDKEKKEKEEKKEKREKKGDKKPDKNILFEKMYKDDTPNKDSPKRDEKINVTKTETTPENNILREKTSARNLNTLHSQLQNDSSNSSVASHDESSVDTPVKVDKAEAKKSKTEKNKEQSSEKKRKRKTDIITNESPSKIEEPPVKVIREEPTVQDPEEKKENVEEGITQDYMSILKDLQHKIMTLQDNTELQRVVQLIAETGHYEITAQTFDFDLCALDRDTVRRLQEFFTVS